MSQARFDIKVTPRASRSQITGWRDGVLHLKVTAPPVDSAANAAVIELLAESLGVPKRAVTIVRGETARLKHVQIEGLSLDVAKTRLSGVER